MEKNCDVILVTFFDNVIMIILWLRHWMTSYLILLMFDFVISLKNHNLAKSCKFNIEGNGDLEAESP